MKIDRLRNAWMDRLYKMDAGGQLDGCLSTIHLAIHTSLCLSIHSSRFQILLSRWMLRQLDQQTESDKIVKGVWCVSQLAVYGACKCSSSAGEPCSCAKSAAASRKQVLQLKQEVCKSKWSFFFYVFLDILKCVCVCVAGAAEEEEGRSVSDGGRVPDCIRAAAEETEWESAAAGRKQHAHTRERCSN